MKKENIHIAKEKAKEMESFETGIENVDKLLATVDVEPTIAVRVRGLVVHISSSLLKADLESQKTNLENGRTLLESEINEL